MSLLNRLDLALRRNPHLPRMSWLRDRLRSPYHRLMALQKGGLELNLGGQVQIRVPAEYCAAELEEYEIETVGAIADWCRQTRGGFFVDLGCSYGYLSCGARFLNPDVHVIAIDADLPSLEVTRRMCRYTPSGRGALTLILGLVGEHESESVQLEDAAARTAGLIGRSEMQDRHVRTSYVTLNTQIPADALPRMTLDGLLGPTLSNRDEPCLIKCDVEGAEQAVVQGARSLIGARRVTFLLSVHPQLLRGYGGSVEGIRGLLEEAGYGIRLLGIDHEEHWLCEPLESHR